MIYKYKNVKTDGFLQDVFCLHLKEDSLHETKPTDIKQHAGLLMNHRLLLRSTTQTPFTQHTHTHTHYTVFEPHLSPGRRCLLYFLLAESEVPIGVFRGVLQVYMSPFAGDLPPEGRQRRASHHGPPLNDNHPGGGGGGRGRRRAPVLMLHATFCPVAICYV
ncbi:unnamed protein product [Boreogadus saida]